MRLVKRILLEEYKAKHANAVKPLLSWEALVRMSKWQTPQDIKNSVNCVDFLSGNRVIFNIGGNKHRLVVVVEYSEGVVVIS